ncbi:uncharacterized protein RCC_08761 [Ramularia collo-cygni]|uniref:Uncharacterized protein n=1 Tax=Ramularia collo-cygni TaxID=112498 RepID=A0A2D3VFY9_9PEZI|nr:uncharacterized protein RCC_08761 [Ramularia collo-cygni]CZT23051.1 uncharacterized protein RCC_08761 [Ramularia collo-cygni]
MEIATMLALGPTTPGSGVLPMSTLWITLPAELKNLILEHAIPKRLDLNLKISLYHPTCAPVVLGQEELEEWDSTILEWHRLPIMTSISRDTRKQALRALKKHTTIFLTLDRRSEIPDSLKIMDRTELRATISTTFCLTPPSYSSSSTIAWELKTKHPTAVELSSIRRLIASYDPKPNSYHVGRVNEIVNQTYSGKPHIRVLGMASFAVESMTNKLPGLGWRPLITDEGLQDWPESLDIEWMGIDLEILREWEKNIDASD